MKLFLSFLVHCCALLVSCAPPRKLEFTLAAERSLGLAKKILTSIPSVHAQFLHDEGWSEADDGQLLEFLSSELKIPASPVLTSEELDMEKVLVRVASGLDLQLRLLQESSNLMKNPEMLRVIMADLRELTEQIEQMRSAAHISGAHLDPLIFTLKPSGNFQKQLLVQRSLQHLQKFSQDVIRSLRRIMLNLSSS